MKARVKGTTAIIDVTFDKDALNAGYPPYRAGGGIYYYPEQLVWIDDVDGAEPDYWEKLKYQYIGMILSATYSSTMFQDTSKEDLYKNAIFMARELVDKLKEESHE